MEAFGGSNPNESKKLPHELNQKLYALVKERYVTQRAEDTTGRKTPRTAEMINAEIQAFINANPEHQDAMNEEEIRLDEYLLNKER